MTYFTTTQILDGKKTADTLLETVRQELLALQNRVPVQPKLVVVLVGDNPASQVYVNKKAKTAQKIGMLSEVIVLPAAASQEALAGEIHRLNLDASVHGILIQLPLPRHLSTQAIISLVDPAKDVDGLHPLNLGRLLTADPLASKPCTPAGIITLLKTYKVPMAGQHAVIIGRSNIVGKPMSLLLLHENATVSIVHSKTEDLPTLTRQADILIAAVGVPRMVTADMVKPGVAVVDVGINRVDGKLCGDVDYAAVAERSSFITPVPGGVGPMTIATLMANTLALYQRSLAH